MHNSSVGANKVQLLLFQLGDDQLYGINVFKVKEVILVPDLDEIPNSSPEIAGMGDYRGTPFVVVDIFKALGKSEVCSERHVICSEFNKNLQGFIVGRVDQTCNVDCADISEPPAGSNPDGNIVSIAKHNGRFVHILDVEKIMSNLIEEKAFEALGSNETDNVFNGKRVLVVDDSVVARSQTQNLLTSLGLDVVTCNDGNHALEFLRNEAKSAEIDGRRIEDGLLLMVTDIEMPQMDGFTLVDTVRSDPMLKNLYIVIQSSIDDRLTKSESKNADAVLTKWDPEKLKNLITKIKG